MVAELLLREQKVAHIVVVSFPLHQIKKLGALQLLNPMQAGEIRCLQLARKNRCFSTRRFETPAAADGMNSGVFVVSDEQCRVVLLSSFVHARPFPKRLPSKAHVGSSDRLRCEVHDHTSTYSVFVHINYKSEQIQVAGEGQN